jgi:hypothetical protein
MLPRFHLYGPLVALMVLSPSLAIAQETPAEGTTPADASQTNTTPDPRLKELDDEKALLDKQAAVLLSRKAVKDAQASNATAAFGPLGTYTGANGDVTVDATNRSVLEASLLSAVALDKAGDQMGLRLCKVIADRRQPKAACPMTSDAQVVAAVAQPSLPAPDLMPQAALCQEVRKVIVDNVTGTGPRPVVIVAQSTAGVTDLADSFLLRTSALGREFCAALETPAKGGDGEVEGGSAAIVGAIVNTIGTLFRADYTVYGIPVTTDQTLLTKRVALAFKASGLQNPVYLPDLSPVGPLDSANPAVRRLAVLDALRSLALAAAATNASAKVRLEAAIKAYDDAFAALNTASDGKPPLMATVIRQAQAAKLIRESGYLVVTNVHVMGGTSYTKKNFFTFLGGMPYFVSGGALASYIVEDGATGSVLDAVTIPMTSGYHRVNQLDRAFPK